MDIEAANKQTKGKKTGLDYRQSLSPCPLERVNSLYVTKQPGGGMPDPEWMNTLKSEAESEMTISTIADNISCSNSEIELVDERK